MFSAVRPGHGPGRAGPGRRAERILAIVGSITLGLTLEAAHLQVGIPPEDSTQITELARLTAPGPVFAAFQLVTALLLLSAASSPCQAGPGLLKALVSFLAGLLSTALFSHRDGRRVLYGAWVRARRPRGIRNVAAEAEEMSE